MVIISQVCAVAISHGDVPEVTMLGIGIAPRLERRQF